MIENFSNVKELRSYIKSISLDRLNLLMAMAGVSDEEKQRKIDFLGARPCRLAPYL